MSFDDLFGKLVRLTGWGLGAYVVITQKVDATQATAIIIAFAGYEVVSRAKEKKLPDLIDERKRRNVEQATEDAE